MIKTKEITVRYATLKAVKTFFGTRSNVISFPTEIDHKDPDNVLFLKALKALQIISPNKNGERLLKPIFSFGRVLLKMSKNADRFALSQCTIYITEYAYNLGDKTENRVQVVIAPPMDNSELDEIDIEDDSWIGLVPQSATEDEEDAFSDEESEDEESEDEEPATKSKKDKKRKK